MSLSNKNFELIENSDGHASAKTIMKFDNQLLYFLEKINQRTADEETLRNLDGLIHLVNSIQFR